MSAEKYLSAVRTDIAAAQAVAATLGRLTRPVLSGVEAWFRDVPIPRPVQVMNLSDEERTNLLVTVLDDLAAAFDAAIETIAAGADYDDVAHANLAATVDPLWRELLALHGDMFNAEFAAKRPDDADELEERITALESMTGMTRSEIVQRAADEPALRLFVDHLGLTLDDFRR